MTKAACYARVSLEEQRDNFSLDMQFDYMRSYAKVNGLEIAKEYREVGSGAEIGRPQLQELLADARAGHFQTIIVYKFDRFSRDQIDLLILARDLKKIGVILKSVNEGFDLSMPMGNILMGLAGGLAQHERETLLKRSRDGMLKRVTSGLFSGGQVPYGYDYNPATGRLEINDLEAKWIKKMFKWATADNLSTTKITERLIALDVPPKRVAQVRFRGWMSATISRILRNPVYKGEFTYNKSKESKNGAKIWKPKEQWIRAAAPAIIDAELFEQAQMGLAKRKINASRNTKNEYLLQGLLVCGECGRRMGGCTSFPSRYIDKRTGRRRTMDICQYYRCPGRDRKHIGHGQEKCLTPHVMAHNIDRVVWSLVLEVLKNPQDIIETAMKQEEEARAAQDTTTGHLAQVNESLQRIRAQEDRLLDLYTKAMIDLATFDKKQGELRRERAGLMKEREGLTKTVNDQNDKAARAKAIMARLDDVRRRAASMPFEERRNLLRDMLTHVKFTKDRQIQIYGILKGLPPPSEYVRTNSETRGHPKDVQFVRSGGLVVER